jgi:hypothetical protein
LEKLNGEWKNDSQYISLMRYGNIQREASPTPGRLILGLGPSGSGKTHWMNTLLEVFINSDSTFPESFISIDGGIYRMTSEIYKLIRDLAHEYCLGGFTNLVRASKINPLKDSLFDAGSIKKNIQAFLKRESTSIQISLYVPETLGGCITNCISSIQPYLEITRDRKSWIGVLIWQHKIGSDCTFVEKYRCVGCTESGKRREQMEGKKYSNKSWEISMRSGYKVILKAPGGSFVIHNSGSTKTSILYSTPENNPIINQILKNFAPNLNYTYIEEKFQKSLPK